MFHPTNAEELLIWDGIVCRNLNNNIAESWMMSKSNTFVQEVAEAMYFWHWLDIKACMKLNEYFAEKKEVRMGMIQLKSVDLCGMQSHTI